MAKGKKKPIQEKDTSVDEWIKLVHGGTCCAINDPQEEEKKLFISKIAKKTEK